MLELIEWVKQILQEQLAAGSLMVYVMIFVGGLIASITPCTYPVLPMTVGYIGSAAEGKKWNAFLLSLTLVAGLAFVYGILGVILAAAGMQFGMIWANGWAVFAIAWFFILMALMLMDVWVMPVPKFLRDLQAKTDRNRRKGFLGAFMVGAVSGLVVGPCTGPILGVVGGAIVASLGAAEGIDYAFAILKGGVMLFIFGFGQGALILACGTFTGLLGKLPRAGSWMMTIKKVFALLILIGASFLIAHAGQQSNFPRLADVLAKFEAAPEPFDIGEESGTESSATSGADSDSGSRYGSDELFE